MYVGITGTNGSGKGEIVKILKRKGFVHYGFGDLLRAEQRRLGMDVSLETTTNFANKLRAEKGAGFLAELLLKRMQDETPKNAVFESIRHPAELAVLRRLQGFVLLSVDAQREVRYERIKHRGRGDDLKSFEQFAAIEDGQLEGSGPNMQMQVVMDEADVKIVNIGNLAELEEQVLEGLGL